MLHKPCNHDYLEILVAGRADTESFHIIGLPLFKGEVYTTKIDVSLIFTSPALYSFTPSFLNNSTELRVFVATPSKGLTVHHAL